MSPHPAGSGWVSVLGGVGGWVRTGADGDEVVAIPIAATLTFVLIVVVSWFAGPGRRRTPT